MTDAIATMTQAGIEKLSTVQAAGKMKQMADAAAIFYKAQEDLVMSQRAKEMSLRSARQAGKLLSGTPKENKGGDRKSRLARARRDLTPYQEALDGTGITEFIAQTWQKLAQVPEELFEEYVTTAKFLHTEFTINGLLHFAAGPREVRDQERCPTCGQVWRGKK